MCILLISSRTATQSSDYCKTTNDGDEFSGSVRHTKSGYLCQVWLTDSPVQKASYFVYGSLIYSTPNNSAILAENKCRNPNKYGNSDGPWCYVVKTSKRTPPVSLQQEYCDVPSCSELDQREAQRKADFGELFCLVNTRFYLPLNIHTFI